MNKIAIKIIGLVATFIGFGASLLTDWVDDKKMDQKIEEKFEELSSKDDEKE